MAGWLSGKMGREGECGKGISGTEIVHVKYHTSFFYCNSFVSKFKTIKMKHIIFFAVIAVTCSLSSCVTEKGFYKPYNNEALNGREPNSDVFIIDKNGKKLEGHTLTYSKTSVWKVQQKESWTAVDGQKVNSDDIAVVQSEKSYSENYWLSKNSSRYVMRLRYGKIGLYTYVVAADAVGGQKDVRGDYHVYVFKKGNGNLEDLTFKSFSNAISDNPEALQKFKSLYPNSKIPTHNEKGNLKDLITVTELYNK